MDFSSGDSTLQLGVLEFVIRTFLGCYEFRMMCWNHVRLLELMLSCKFRSACLAQASFYSGEGVVYVGKVMHQPDLEGYVCHQGVCSNYQCHNSMSVDVFVPIIFHHVACAELVPSLMPAIR